MEIRLYDRIMAGRYQLAPFDLRNRAALDHNEWAGFSQAFGDLLVSAERIVADNIEEFCADAWPGHERMRADLLAEQIPNIIPPFPQFWVEWRNSQDYMRRKGWVAGGVAATGEHLETGGWRIRWIPVGAQDQSPAGVLIAPFGWAETVTDENGSYLYTDCHVGGRFVTERDRAEDEKWIGAHMYTFLTAISFMNCRNVELPWVQPSGKLARAFGRRNKGAKLAPYRTIDIIPMTRLIAEKAKAEGRGRGEVAFQTVRGHFKRYSGSGLFGKLKGTFFFGAHDRGTGERKTRQGGYRIKL